MRSPVDYEVVDRVAWLTINRPEARNALDSATRAGLWDGTHRFVADDDALVLILTATGSQAFCAGGDLKEMAEIAMTVPPADAVPQFGRNIDVPKPTIAAVNGVAFAGGFLLAQMCDLCVAADTARFAITEARVGRGTPWAVPLPWLIPPRVALELLLTGQPIDATRAREVGLVNHVVPAGDLRDAADGLARTILANAPLSVRAAKATVYETTERSRSAAFAAAEELWGPVYRSNDAQEGPQAFRDGRRPAWTGT